MPDLSGAAGCVIAGMTLSAGDHAGGERAVEGHRAADDRVAVEVRGALRAGARGAGGWNCAWVADPSWVHAPAPRCFGDEDLASLPLPT